MNSVNYLLAIITTLSLFFNSLTVRFMLILLILGITFFDLFVMIVRE